ncbi:MAG: hypothetical protein K8R49_02570 [Candidatus Cloacimonetes bacterium]|nr:hypothetical protein [Candidatus Cloacimonadota bacterium]
MKKIYILLIIFSLCLSASAEQISKGQDELNKNYLIELDANLTQTIKILTAFNDTANKIPDSITGLGTYKIFLMEMTLECSNIKRNIQTSEEESSIEREVFIQTLISSLKPDVQFLPVIIDNKKDDTNRELMDIFFQRIQKHLSVLRKSILEEEKGVMESGTFNKYFLDLHSRHFIYLLTCNLIEPSESLSRENRDFLIKIIRNIEESLMEEE